MVQITDDEQADLEKIGTPDLVAFQKSYLVKYGLEPSEGGEPLEGMLTNEEIIELSEPLELVFLLMALHKNLKPEERRAYVSLVLRSRNNMDISMFESGKQRDLLDQR